MSSPTLLLVPTSLERAALDPLGPWPAGVQVELCGFGPVLAGARAAGLLAALRPARVLLLGIAGTYDEQRAPLASAHAFRRCALHGVGAQSGEELLGPAELLPQWPGDAHTPPIVEHLDLAHHGRAAQESLLLTTCAAAGSPAQAAARRARFPGALAEDMEGFAVAAACALAGLPCGVVRGISNPVGDRDHARWQVRPALAAARTAALAWLEATP